jgi:hypothetical protein
MGAIRFIFILVENWSTLVVRTIEVFWRRSRQGQNINHDEIAILRSGCSGQKICCIAVPLNHKALIILRINIF